MPYFYFTVFKIMLVWFCRPRTGSGPTEVVGRWCPSRGVTQRRRHADVRVVLLLHGSESTQRETRTCAAARGLAPL